MIPFTFQKFHEKQTCVSINGGTFSASSSLSTANGITNTYASLLTHKTKDRGEIRTYLSAIHNEFVRLLFDVNVAIRCYWKERCAPYLLCLVRFVHNLTSILLELPMPFVELVEWCKSLKRVIFKSQKF